jgi:hypothetical protein
MDDQIAMKCRFIIMGRRSQKDPARWLAQTILPVADLEEAKIQAHHFPNTASCLEGAEGVRVLDKDGREIYSWWLAENEV